MKLEKRVIDNKKVVMFFKKRTTRKFKKAFGISFPFFGENRGKMLVNADAYSFLVNLFINFNTLYNNSAFGKLNITPKKALTSQKNML